MTKPDLDIKAFCLSQGADLVGIADLNLLKGRLITVPGDLLDPYLFALSMAIQLDDKVVDGVERGPTPEYAEHCKSTNLLLESLTTQAAEWISAKGFAAFPVPVSKQQDTKRLAGHISHKAVARMAGIGWQGKSLLIVNSEFGPRIRLATVLTDMPLVPDGPIVNRCGECTECTDACPAFAIKNVSTEDYYAHREDAIYLKKCHEKLVEFKDRPGIGYTFCGVCIKVCPWGKKQDHGVR